MPTLPSWNDVSSARVMLTWPHTPFTRRLMASSVRRPTHTSDLYCSQWLQRHLSLLQDHLDRQHHQPRRQRLMSAPLLWSSCRFTSTGSINTRVWPLHRCLGRRQHPRAAMVGTQWINIQPDSRRRPPISFCTGYIRLVWEAVFSCW